MNLRRLTGFTGTQCEERKKNLVFGDGTERNQGRVCRAQAVRIVEMNTHCHDSNAPYCNCLSHAPAGLIDYW